ncbi:MAG: ligase-associated DNA damage response exonuclease [Gemmatimonas sp.]
MLLRVTDRGLYCEAADCFIDPWSPVDRAIVTHAHGDHLAWGCGSYLVSNDGLGVTRERLGQDAAKVEAIAYGESRSINGVTFSLHPAGHILGSAQVRVEYHGEVWVVSGDYKTDADATCALWEPVRCHSFVTESTFGLPLYRWPTQQSVFDDINTWWRSNATNGRASLLFGYALGKAQRLLSGLDASIGPVLTHGSVERMTACYRAAGIALPPTSNATSSTRNESWSRSMIIAPPSAAGSTWTRRFGNASTAFASGWMHVRGARRRRSVDRGFTLSDHVDWPQLLSAIDATGAERVFVTHGFSEIVVRWLLERGLEAHVLKTRYEGERDDATSDTVEQNASAVDEDSATRSSARNSTVEQNDSTVETDVAARASVQETKDIKDAVAPKDGEL